jgi:hypothetical protein
MSSDLTVTRSEAAVLLSMSSENVGYMVKTRRLKRRSRNCRPAIPDT